ncbi:hypothetical protein [Streptomyces sp. GESEQ-35]|uniref:hypothetical protein n=1 Tax=Streptomyces sp. GESEQ-35 TaxID=2812657 RepID=UPI001B323295|nr:hypothetical protein [Streptomyces sp. GESEQ-35]
MLDTALPDRHRRPRAERFARWGGLALGAALAWGIAGSDRLGSGILLATPVFGICAVAGILAADALSPKPEGPVRRAGLTPRRIRDFLPTRFAALLATQAAALIALLAAAAFTASADDMGRAGRTLGAACDGLTESHGPWPGLFYGVPILGALAFSTAACGYVLYRSTRRPVPDGDPALRAADEEQRRDRVLAVTAAWGLLVSAPLAGTAFFASGALRSLSCLGPASHTVGWILLPVAAAAGCTAVWCLYVLAVPLSAPRRQP